MTRPSNASEAHAISALNTDAPYLARVIALIDAFQRDLGEIAGSRVWLSQDAADAITEFQNRLADARSESAIDAVLRRVHTG